jgi:hypothetical protein
MRSPKRGRAAGWLLAGVLLAGAAQAQDDDRSQAMFQAWLPARQSQVQAFEAYLAREQLAGVVPTWQLLRSASMWRECQAQPFELPPAAQWRQAGEVLLLLKVLRGAGVLGPFAVVSAYRGGRLNRCAGGAPRSSHFRSFAVDIIPLAPADDQKLCAFWKTQGRRWEMGLSRYPSGRIHVDRAGWRTWGADHTRASSFCFQKSQALRP